MGFEGFLQFLTVNGDVPFVALHARSVFELVVVSAVGIAAVAMIVASPATTAIKKTWLLLCAEDSRYRLAK